MEASRAFAFSSAGPVGMLILSALSTLSCVVLRLEGSIGFLKTLSSGLFLADGASHFDALSESVGKMKGGKDEKKQRKA